MIRFENVTKVFGTRKVLDGVSYEIEKGEIFTIVGPSGTGKSVSLKHMIRLLTPTSGRVWIGDDCVSEASGRDLSRIRSRFGYLFQSAALLAWMSVYDNIALPLREKTKMTEGEIGRRVADALEKVGLEKDGAKFPSDLSGGMQKRAGLARAIVTEPEIVLYDEPTSGLDPVTSRRIDELIADLSGRLGITSVVVTHDLHSALSISTRIAMLGGGRVLSIEPPSEFIHSKIPQARAFLDAQYITRRGAWEAPSA
ncbi:MAG: ATP-binding cassette domain-containing protein [Kiritimatiellae bacterium]|nr:ATP-binding cassette domain-containing protein [Kiritimatiellia bacterium]